MQRTAPPAPHRPWPWPAQPWQRPRPSREAVEAAIDAKRRFHDGKRSYFAHEWKPAIEAMLAVTQIAAANRESGEAAGYDDLARIYLCRARADVYHTFREPPADPPPLTVHESVRRLQAARVTLAAVEQPLARLLRTLSEAARVPVRLDPELGDGPSVTVVADGMTVWAVLEYAMQTQGLDLLWRSPALLIGRLEPPR